MTLFDLNQGERAIITKVKGRGAFRKRITEMGFIPGIEIKVVKKAPLKDPIEYLIMDYNVSLRNSEAKMIDVLSEKEAEVILDKRHRYMGSKNRGHRHRGFRNIDFKNREYNGIIDENLLKRAAKRKGKTINVALVGNPNSGKTTIFNYASGSKERVGNYGGVTVNAKEAKIKFAGYVFNVIDLPGTYSTSAYSLEELYVRDYILENFPDIILDVIDASNLERNLYLTTQLIDMDRKVIVALNMYDELKEKGDKFDYNSLGKMIGIPFVPTIASKGIGINNLLQKIIQVYEDKDETVRHIHINYGFCIEKAIKEIQDSIYKENRALTDRISTRFLSIKLLEKDKDVKKYIEQCPNKDDIYKIVNEKIEKIEKAKHDNGENIITNAKYGFIAGALKETLKPNPERKKRKSDVIDTILTHKFWGIPIFIFFMWVMFYTTFTVGKYPMEWIGLFVNWISNILKAYMPACILKDLIIDGVIAGVGSVIVYLPNIIILFLFISIMEDTGYMARAVFIMDKAMHKIGLHGKSFIPLIMGFGCNIPAILSTRIIESKRDRMITMLINPFMSCSARLPVYILFISAFFVSYQALILFSMYFIGILVAILSSLLLGKTLFKKSDMPFVMELPPYRIPTAKSVLKHMWFNTEQYLKKIGGVVLIATIVIWMLGYFPREADPSKKYETKIINIENQYNKKISSAKVINQKNVQILSKEKENNINNILSEEQAKRQENSYIGRVGKFIEPVMHPLGFDWKMSVAVLAGISAKEVVVSTLGILYQTNINDKKHTNALVKKLQQQTYQSGVKKGKKFFNPLRAFVFMLFILLYFPCIGTIAAIRKESGSWKWALFEVFYTTSLAWILSFAVFQIGSLF